MKLPGPLTKKLFYFGPITVVYSWAAILLAAHLNPWWNVTTKALSYMGAPDYSQVPWVYNYVAMVPTGILIGIFSTSLFGIARNRSEFIGSLLFFLAGLSVVLIGIFHQTPGPLEVYHEIFSLLFFLLALISAVFWGAGILMEGRRHVSLRPIALALGLFMAGLALLSLAFTQVIHVPEDQLFVGELVVVLLILLGMLTFVLWGVKLALQGGRPLGLGMIGLSFGALAVFTLFFLAFAGVPGGVGEVLGILAVELWIALMVFAREPVPYGFRSEIPSSRLRPGEVAQVRVRPALLHAIPVRALVYGGLGLFFFFYAYYYLMSNLVSLILVKDYPVGTVMGYQVTHDVEVVVLTVVFYLTGYLLIVLGAARWRQVLPPWPFRGVLSLTVVVPLIMVATWFSGTGDTIMLIYLLIVAILAPLGLSLALWHRARYAVTDLRVIASERPSPETIPSLPLEEARVVSLKQTWFQRLMDVGDIDFLQDVYRPHGPGDPPRNGVRWAGVARPRVLLEGIKETYRMGEVSPGKTRVRAGWFLAAFAVFTILLVLLTLVPVFSVTDTITLPCAIYTKGTGILSDPWPYVHNVTLAPGHVGFRWWSGSPVWILVVQMPVGIAYQNTNVNSLLPGAQSNLTSLGQGGFTSLGGSSFAGCVATASDVTVTLVLSYSAPLVWE